MASAELHRSLARTLPIRLQNFFAVCPPAAVLAAVTSSNPSSTAQKTSHVASSTPSTSFRNPFLPYKNAGTGRWHPPKFSLRRQAEIVKLARKYDVEELLPYSPKKTEERTKRREEHGLRVKGTGVGQRVKGHEWERTLKGRLEKRRQAMLDMPKMIQQWKEVCKGTLVHVLGAY